MWLSSMLPHITWLNLSKGRGMVDLDVEMVHIFLEDCDPTARRFSVSQVK